MSTIEKNTAKNFFPIFWSKIAIYLFPCLHKDRSSYRRSLQPSKGNIHHFKKLNLSTFFYFCGFFFAFLDPDPISVRNTVLKKGKMYILFYFEGFSFVVVFSSSAVPNLYPSFCHKGTDPVRSIFLNTDPHSDSDWHEVFQLKRSR